MPPYTSLPKPACAPRTLAASLAAIGSILLPGAAGAQALPLLPAVEVVGRSMSGTYQASEVAGTKSVLPLRELPQSVRVMTRQAIDDLGATRLDDLLDYVGGVSRQNNFGGLWDNFAIRGMPGNQDTGMPTLLNGFSGNRGFNAPRDMAQVERIEFLKGPAAALYGTSEPGGTLNIVTKAPLWRAAHALETYRGSHDSHRVALDSTGPLNEVLAYRVNAALEKRGNFRDLGDGRRKVFAPALTWRLAPASTLEYNGEWLRHAAPLDRGVVAVGNELDKIPRERFLGEPGDGDVTLTNRTHQLALRHEWSDAWSTRLALSQRSTSLHGYSTEPTALLANGTLTRQRRHRDYQSDDLAVQGELMGRLEAGAMRHDLLLGVETYRFEFDQRMLRINPSASAPYAIDIFNPVYGQRLPVPLPNTSTFERQRNLAVYAQDSVYLAPQWRLLAGARIDRYRQDFTNRRNARHSTQAHEEAAPRIGLSWLPSTSWTVYGSASTSFRPNIGADSRGGSFDPERGRALELGVKWESARRDMGATAALFDIRKRNALTGDPGNPGFSIAAGEVVSRGLEFDLAGQLSRHWRLNASFIANDAEIKRDNTLLAGSRILNVPRVNGSLLAVYESSLGGARYSIGGGLTHVGARLGEARTRAPSDLATPEFELPAYTSAKLVAHWRLSERLRLSLDIDNLFDRSYYASSYSRVWVTPGAARSITVGLQGRL